MAETAATTTERPESGWMFFPGYEYQGGTLYLYDPGIYGIADPMKLDFYKHNLLVQAIHQGSRSRVGGGLFGGLSLSGITDRDFSWPTLATPDCTDAAGHPGETDPEADCYMDYARYTIGDTSLTRESSSFGFTVGGILTQQVKPWLHFSERLGLQLPFTPHGIDSARFFLDAEDDASLYFLDSVRTTSGSLDVVASVDTAPKKGNGLVVYAGISGTVGGSELIFTKDDTYLASDVTAPERVIKGITTLGLGGIVGASWRLGKVIPYSPTPEVDTSVTPEAEANATEIINKLEADKPGVIVNFLPDEENWDIATIDLSGFKGTSLNDDTGKRVVTIYIKKNPAYKPTDPEGIEYFVTARTEDGSVATGDLFKKELKKGELETYITELFTKVIKNSEEGPKAHKTIKSDDIEFGPSRVREFTVGQPIILGWISIAGQETLPVGVTVEVSMTTPSGETRKFTAPLTDNGHGAGVITVPADNLKDIGTGDKDFKVTVRSSSGGKLTTNILGIKIKSDNPVVSEVKVVTSRRGTSPTGESYGYEPMTKGSFGVTFSATVAGYATVTLPNGYVERVQVKAGVNEVVFEGSQDGVKPPNYLTDRAGSGAVVIQVTDSSYNPLSGVAAVNGESVEIGKLGTTTTKTKPKKTRP